MSDREDAPPVPQRVAVVGAGIVGISCALQIRKLGCEVVVVDPLEPGEACSFGNAGVVAVSSIVPLITPRALLHAPRWLLDRQGPFAVDWRDSPRLLPWFARAAGTATPKRMRRIARALRGLHGRAVDDHFIEATEAGCCDLLQRTSYLHVYEHEDAFRADAFAWCLRRELGIDFQLLKPPEIRDLEPALAPSFERGVLLQGHAMALDPGRLVKRLAEDVRRRQGRMLQDRVRAIRLDDGVRLETEGGSVEANAVVIAAGAWSAKLAGPLGHKFPLVAERGYHAMVDEPKVHLRQPVMFAERKFVAASMQHGLRLAGTAEFADIDRPANMRRAEALFRQARRHLPELDAARAERWMGPRPSLPDTLPLIGRSQLHGSVYFAFGHGHTGLTASATTGRIIADLMANRSPPIDVEPFRSDRFPVGRAA